MVQSITVAFQGEPGAFSEEAVETFFADGAERIAVPTWRAVFGAVRDGDVLAGVVAVESSLAGSIRETYDLLSEFYESGVSRFVEPSGACTACPGRTPDAYSCLTRKLIRCLT